MTITTDISRKMAAHTPGPWQVMMGRDQFGGTSYKVRNHTRSMIAVAHDGSFWSQDYSPKSDEDGYYLPDDQMDCHADRVLVACLIAAAPELLDALKDCALEIAQIHNRKLTRNEQMALDNARAVIAKAEGLAA